jgi:NADPH:quinone reductase-like Zn-dependent oxidoreductase
MQAIAIERFGGPEELELVDLPEPRVPPDALLIRTQAAALNPVTGCRRVRPARMPPPLT